MVQPASRDVLKAAVSLSNFSTGMLIGLLIDVFIGV
jgi:hypothetical protein